MSRPDAPPELLALFDEPGRLAAMLRGGEWPLRGSRVAREALEGVDLFGGEIADTDFDVGLLARAHWRELRVRNCSFSCDFLTDVRLEGVSFIDCVFSGTRISDARLERVEMERCVLEELHVSETAVERWRLAGATITRCTFERVALSEVTLSTSVVADSRFVDLDVHGLHANEVSVEGVRLSGGEWSGLQLESSQLAMVEATASDVLDVTMKGGRVAGYSQSSGTLTRICLDGLEALSGATMAAVQIASLVIRGVARCDALAILRSSVTGLQVQRAGLLWAELRDSTFDEAIELREVDVHGLDVRAARIRGVAMTGGRLGGTLRLGDASISGWQMNQTDVAASLVRVGRPTALSQSDPRLMGAP